MKLRRLGPRAIVLCAIALACCAVFGAASPSAVGATQTITLSADNLAPGAGDTVTLTATVTNSDGTTPSGTVKFFDGTVQMGDPVTLVPVPGSASQAVALFSTSFVAGPHSLTASYRNKSFITTTTPPLVLNVGHVATHPTTITLTSDPTVVVPGEPVTLTATVAAGGGAPVPTGLVSFDDNGVPFFPVSGGVLDASGHATLTVSGFGSGAHVIHASYPGDGIDSASAAVLNVTVPEQPQAVDTTVDVSVDPSYIHEGDAVTIVAHVQQVGAAISPPAGSLVSFYANDVPLDPANAPLDANGNATIVVSGGWQTGSDYKITATYVGDASFKTSSGDGFVSVLPPDAPLTVPTQLAYAGDTSGVYGTTAHLSGVLTTSAGPVANEPVVFTLGAQTCTGITDSTGLAACTVIVGQTPGNYTVDAAFAGDGLLLSTDITHAFAIGRQTTTLTYTGATSADYGDSATLSATLRDGPGAGLVGKSVTLALGSQTCPATTGPGGIASCTIAHVTQTPGSYTLTVSFAGDTVYFPSSASPTFQVRKESTTATVTAIGAVAAGSVQLRGTLLEDGLPLGGATVTLSLGSFSCPATTNAAGVASCSLSTTTLGPATVGISYAGDANYLGSSASISGGALVFAFASGGGSFVIGDGNSATGTAVTFWGAQWAKLNKVSGGAAPEAFKGFAAQAATACGTTWSTGPGNSASPPAGNLPAYMAVLVTSAVGKSGSAISGSTVHIVVVKTDGGYKNDPGHAGTGTVVATVC